MVSVKDRYIADRQANLREAQRILADHDLKRLQEVLKVYNIEKNWELQTYLLEGGLDHLSQEDRDALWEASDKRSDPINDKRSRIVADYAMGSMSFPRWIWSQVIDQPAMQRLRGLKQMGTCHYVYPDAMQTRFRHSMAVGHLARDWFDKLQDKSGITGHAEWREAIRDATTIAGLCHDIGHGPMSHAFEKMINEKRPENPWCHEDMSVKLFEHLCDTSEKLGSMLDEAGTRKMVTNIIKGENIPARPTYHDPVWDLEAASHNIVANKQSGCDVDRFEYLIRDCCVAKGLPQFDPLRLTTKSRVCDGKIVFNAKEADELVRFYTARFNIYARVYTHPKAQGVDHMYADVFREIDPVFKFSGSLDDCDKYLELTDSSLTDWVYVRKRLSSVWEDSEHSSNLREAEKILTRLANRDLYRFAGEVQLLESFDTNLEQVREDICGKLPKDWKSVGDSGKCPIIVDVTRHDFGVPGTGGKDNCSPWDSVLLYQTDKDGAEQLQKLPELWGSCYPAEWCRKILRVFCRHGADVDVCREAFCKWAAQQPKGSVAETPEFLFMPRLQDVSTSCGSPRTPGSPSPGPTYWLHASSKDAGSPCRMMRGEIPLAP